MIITYRGQQSIAVSVDANQLKNRRSIVVEAVGARKFMKQEQHDSEKETAAIAGVVEYVLEYCPYVMALSRLSSRVKFESDGTDWLDWEYRG